MSWVDRYIREVPDFPKPGIVFKDITPLVQDPEGFRRAVDEMAELFPRASYDRLVGIESRGFLFAAPLAYKLGLGCTVVRKQGKLPAATISHAYALEYGEATVEMHVDGVVREERVLLVDDLLATGGTVAAAAALVRRLGGRVVGGLFLIELSFLKAAERLDFPVRALRSY